MAVAHRVRLQPALIRPIPARIKAKQVRYKLRAKAGPAGKNGIPQRAVVGVLVEEKVETSLAAVAAQIGILP